MKAFVSAVLGGIGNLPGAIVGGLLMGICEEMVAGYLSSTYRDALAFGLLIVVLLVKPNGTHRGKPRWKKYEGPHCRPAYSVCEVAAFATFGVDAYVQLVFLSAGINIILATSLNLVKWVLRPIFTRACGLHGARSLHVRRFE